MLLAVDWDAQRLRIVHAAVRRGKVRIDKMLSVDFPPDLDQSDSAAMGGLLREVLNRLKIRTRRVLLDVPRDQALLTTLNLPAASPDEMPALVEFQIAKELPFSLSEAIVDFAMPEETTPEGKMDVLVGTVRRDVVAFYERTCEAAGLVPERLGLRPYANKVAVNELIGRHQPGCTMMVDVGPRLTEIDVISNGRLAFSRAASVAVGPMTPLAGGEHDAGEEGGEREHSASSIIRFPQAQEASADPIDRVVDALVVEVTRSFEAFRAQGLQHSLDRVIVGGDVGVEARLAEALSRRLRTQADLYNPAQCFEWPEERGREARAYAAALGLVCGHGDAGRLHFDFLHPKKAVTVTARRLRKLPAVAAAVTLFVVAGVGFYMTSVAPKQQALAKTKQEIEDVNDEIKDLKQYDERTLEPVKQFESEQVVWIDELNRLMTLLPGNEDAMLTRIDMYQKGGRINLTIECRQTEVAMETVNRIDEYRLPGSDSPHFDATAKTFSTRTSGGRYQSSGSIEVQVLGVPDA